MKHLMGSCAQGKAPVTVGNASARLRSGIFLESSVSVMTETVTRMKVLSVQGTESVTVGTVTAGKNGLETPVRSGLEQNTNEVAVAMRKTC